MIPKTCIYCSSTLKLLSLHKSDFVNCICLKCGSHYYESENSGSKWYTKQEWSKWIEGGFTNNSEFKSLVNTTIDIDDRIRIKYKTEVK